MIMAKVKRYVQGYNFIYVDETELREECHREMRVIAPDGTSEETLYAMGETLFNIATSPKI